MSSPKFKKDSLFKEEYEIGLFFNSGYIRLHNAYEYLKEKGIFAFPNEMDGMGKFVSNLFIGIDSQDNLHKYMGIKAYPTMSGFILEGVPETSLEEFQNYLNAHTNEILIEKNEAKLTHIFTEFNKLSGEVEYFGPVRGYNIFDTVKRSATFEITETNNSFSMSFLLNRDSDYYVIHNILSTILQNDLELELKLIEYNYAIFPTTNQRHELLLQLLNQLGRKYKVLGVIKYYRNKAEDLSTPDDFEERLRRGNQEIEIMDAKEVLINLEARGACVEGVNVPLYLDSSNYFFVIQMKAKKGRLELGLVGDIRKIDNSEILEGTLNREFITSLEIIHLSENEKHEILKDIWHIVSTEFYDYRTKFIERTKF